MMAHWNSHFGVIVGEMKDGKWFSPKNESGQARTYLLCSLFKVTKPPEGGDKPWNLGDLGLLDHTEDYRLIGVDDAKGKKYNKAIITVTWVKASAK